MNSGIRCNKTMRKIRIKKYLLPVISIVLILFLLEVGSRVLFTIKTDIQEYNQQIKSQWFEYSSEIGWERQPNYSGEVYGTIRSFDKNGYFTIDGEQLNDTTTPKILLIGDSCIFGNWVEITKTFGEILENILTDYDIINLGVPGYTSYQGVKVLEKYIAKIKPRIIIVSFNYNDRRYVLHPNDIDSKEYFTKVYTSKRANSMVVLHRYSYLFRIMRYGYDAFMKSFIEVGGKQTYWVDAVYPRVSLQDYRANIIKMIELAQQHNAQMMLLSLRDNSYETLFLQQGIELLNQGKSEDAIVKFNEGLDSEIFSILARKYLVDIHKQQNQQAESNAFRRIKKADSSLHGGRPLLLDSEYETITQTISSDYNIPLIEGGKALQEHPEYYIDMCHFDKNGHLLLAKMIADIIREQPKTDE